jgi:hypothetical protein
MAAAVREQIKVKAAAEPTAFRATQSQARNKILKFNAREAASKACRSALTTGAPTNRKTKAASILRGASNRQTRCRLEKKSP